MTDLDKVAEAIYARMNDRLKLDSGYLPKSLDKYREYATHLAQAAIDAMGWRSLDGAPRNGTKFLALNADGEIFVAKFTTHGRPRLCYRQHGMYEPRRRILTDLADGSQAYVEDESFNKEHRTWHNKWVYWDCEYDFAPTHWCPLPPDPKEEA